MTSIDVDRIKDNVDVWMVLDEIGVRRYGHRVFCPFCHDAMSRNPGASVTRDGEYFVCWVCDVRGDVIALAQEYQQTDFVSACRWLEDTFDVR